MSATQRRSGPGVESSFHQIISSHRVGIPSGGAVATGTSVDTFDPGLTHQPFRSFAGDRDVLAEFEFGPYFRCAVRASGLPPDLGDGLVRAESSSRRSAWVGLPRPPLVEAGDRHLHHPTRDRHAALKVRVGFGAYRTKGAR
jgi:hypothetical protein